MKYKRIPKGPYCYGTNGICCPYWKEEEGRPYQLNGYCELLEIGDWMDDPRAGELWDQIKVCTINENW